MPGIDGLRFQVRDTAPSRTSKLEAVRSIVFSIVSADLRTRLTNAVFGSGEYFPINVGAMDGIGRIVPIANEGNVFEIARAIRVASKDWQELSRNRTWQGFWRFRVQHNDPLNIPVAPVMGFLVYDYFGRYLGTFANYTHPAIAAIDGWKDYTYTTTSELVKATYPTATYIRTYWERTDKGRARTQISRFRAPIDYTDVTRLEASIGAAGDAYDSLAVTVGNLDAAVTINATAISTLEGDFASLTTSVSTLGSSVTTIAAAQTTQAGDIASLKIQVRAGGNGNLIYNGSSEAGLDEWVSSYGIWNRTNTNIWGPYFYVDNAGSVGDKFYVLRHNPVPWNPGYQATFTCGMDLSADGAAVGYVEVRFLNDTNAVIAGATYSGPQLASNIGFANDADNRDDLKLTTPVAPAGTASVQVSVVFFTPDGVNLLGGAFRRAKLEQGDKATAYSSEASINQAFTAISDVTGQYATLSTTVSTQGGYVTTLQSAMTTVEGYTSTRWTVTAVSGGRAQLSVYSDSNGGGGVDITGDVNITGNATITGIVKAAAFVTDQGVDYGAIVPGQLNTNASADQSGSNSLPPRVPPAAPNTAVIAQTPTISITANDAIFINWAVTHSGLDGVGGAFVYLQKSTDNVNWFTIDQLPTGIGSSGGSYSLSYEDISHGAGNYMLRLLVRNGTSVSAGNAIDIDTSGGYIRLRKFFSK